MKLIRVDDIRVEHADFIRIVDLIRTRGRPLKTVFADPSLPEFRDSFDFLCSEAQMRGELEYHKRTRAHRTSVDREWTAFLGGLASENPFGERGGRQAGPPSVAAQDGVKWLRRDARGVIAFDGGGGATGSEGGVTAAAGHGADFLLRTAESARGGDALRLLGLHSGAAPPSLSAAGPLRPGGGGAMSVAQASAGLGAGQWARPGGGIGGEGAGHPGDDELDEEAAAAEGTVRAMHVFKRCWRPGSVGVAKPMGNSTPEAARAAMRRGRAALLSEPGGAGPDGRPMASERREELRLRLQSLVSAGVPAAFRGSVWYAMSGAAAKRALHPPGYYATLSRCRADPEALRIVRKDVPRTFPGHPFFETDGAQEALARLLLAHVAHSPSVGYCQSLNFVAALLLWVMEEEEAFWVLDCLVHEILPPQFWSPDMTGCRAEQAVLAQLVEKFLPRLSRALDAAGLPLYMICTEWFVALFSTVLPVHTALRVWDCMFLHGTEALFRVAIALLSRAEAQLGALGIDFGDAGAAGPGSPSASSLTGMGGLFQLLKTLPYDVHDEDALIDAAFPPGDGTNGPSGRRHGAAGPAARIARFFRRSAGAASGAGSGRAAGNPSGSASSPGRTRSGQPGVRWGLSMGPDLLAEAREVAWRTLRQQGERSAGKGVPGRGRKRAVGGTSTPVAAAAPPAEEVTCSPSVAPADVPAAAAAVAVPAAESFAAVVRPLASPGAAPASIRAPQAAAPAATPARGGAEERRLGSFGSQDSQVEALEEEPEGGGSSPQSASDAGSADGDDLGMAADSADAEDGVDDDESAGGDGAGPEAVDEEASPDPLEQEGSDTSPPGADASATPTPQGGTAETEDAAGAGDDERADKGEAGRG
ncbi:hypothetical protein FNF29_07431 [Cafeteria roenbergensis]|uniref:Rab-GAP TBC domain-containing protein n=2 Tax=Cafeteria roenbergensis TaxID=33653 RepID=A0A5A8C2Z7_CAFRO|nr:hypothetical protein FNF29_07431 [Cafeteria roenbergensis]|eukprot:KAA0147363.1 hypothetical protein FNF29_07431 [Cafeteria roenbergensis]